jgi:hypothetical protein
LASIGSPEINKVLRKYLRPILTEHGFQTVEPRKAWGWHSPFVWTFGIRAVGGYFSEVTGWPPMSIGAKIGMYYEFIPSDYPIKSDNNGRLLPDVNDSHRTLVLHSTLDQSRYLSALDLPAERNRLDVWWIEPDGSNVAEVCENLALAFLDQAESWFKRFSNIPVVFAEIQAELTCFTRYKEARYFAEHLGEADKARTYQRLAEAERLRIEQLFTRENSST